MEYSGSFETHITLAPDIPTPIFQHHAARLGAKLLIIELARGLSPIQPMLTLHAKGTLSHILQNARSIQDSLHSAGLHVTRIKIEAAITNSGIPQTDAQAAIAPAQYFEHHLKLALPALTPPSLDSLAKLAQIHNGHLSRNALTVHADGTMHRFITQRCHAAGLSTATVRLSALVHTLQEQNLHPVKVEQEYVVYDGNIALDHGWLTSNPSISA